MMKKSNHKHGYSLAIVLAALLLLTGCGQSGPAKFTLNLDGKRLSEVTQQQKQQVVDALTAMFGTPDDPYVFPEAAQVLNIDKIKLAAGAFGGNADGSQRGLYRQHCVHCHGVSGDGAGPTALFLVPYPRDYRRGIYKFKATQRSAKPSDEDLAHVIRQGVAGTAMPSFLLLPSDEVEALVEYVKYLSVRGETEALLWSLAESGDLEMTRESLVEQLSASVGMWSQALANKVEVPDYPTTDDKRLDLAAWKEAGLDKFYADAFKLAEKKDAKAWHNLGEAVFRGGRAQCMKCHGPQALGDGSLDDPIFDDWNKPKADERKGRNAAYAEGKNPGEKLYWLLPEQVAQPRNLRLGIYRGGRSPADLYRRIHAGINGTPMPEGRTTLKPLEIWAVVDYVRALPYDAMSRHAHQHPTAAVHKDRM